MPPNPEATPTALDSSVAVSVTIANEPPPVISPMLSQNLDLIILSALLIHLVMTFSGAKIRARQIAGFLLALTCSYLVDFPLRLIGKDDVVPLKRLRLFFLRVRIVPLAVALAASSLALISFRQLADLVYFLISVDLVVSEYFTQKSRPV